ncbi:NAD(P)H-flavin reductase [Alteromonas aestuariivivens]|uniref:NAD(P)H-flavin reductase n=1 Tax=Alteromonas aestuariivivens TaxID=1938339 RepID=A0A3D8MAU1_9ALTE|nr:NAD(P)H-flavin reductase [Alteromonas aestuariivivens]RDV26602.1 NAD(P)H-flavin reductase [Alteromonas aestuariivivens]
MSEFHCQVAQIVPLTKVVYKVELIPSVPVDFKAGQYVLVHMGENDKRPFSIASAAYENQRIELHIGADENNAYATEVLERMKNDGEITLSGGHGEAYLQPNGNPMILIAGGTGFSYTYSILKQALHDDPQAEVHLYWGGRHVEDLYLFDELTSLAEQHSHFSFLPVVEFAHDDWTGRTGWVHHAVLADYPSLAETQVYIAGRFEMAKTARDDFKARGMDSDNLFGDAYAFI